MKAGFVFLFNGGSGFRALAFADIAAGMYVCMHVCMYVFMPIGM